MLLYNIFIQSINLHEGKLLVRGKFIQIPSCTQPYLLHKMNKMKKHETATTLPNNDNAYINNGIYCVCNVYSKYRSELFITVTYQTDSM